VNVEPQPQKQTPPAPFQPQNVSQGGGSRTARMAGGTFTLLVICAAVAVGYFKGERLAKAVGGVPGMRMSKARANVATTIAQSLRAQVQLYRLQHMDNLPDFHRYPGWEQLSQYTDEAGRPSPIKTPQFKYGPYVQSVVTNPLNDLSNVATLGDVQDGTRLPEGMKAGYVMDKRTGRVWLTDATGARVVSLERLAKEVR